MSEQLSCRIYRCVTCGDERVWGSEGKSINPDPYSPILPCHGKCKGWTRHKYSGVEQREWVDHALFFRVNPYGSKAYEPGDSLRGGELRKAEE